MIFGDIALVLLASGLSERFEGGDKLMAMLAGRPVLAHAARALSGHKVNARVAIVGTGQTERRALLEAMGWSIAENAAPELGQGSALAVSMQFARDRTKAGAALILLGDMPNVPALHLAQLAAALGPEVAAIMSEAGGVLCPPALFRRSSFDALCSLEGDRGARDVFKRLGGTKTIACAAEFLLDIDTAADLAYARRIVQA